jgi:S1/P1 Nuclease
MKTPLLMALVLSLINSSLFAWSAPGHRAIAEAALDMIQGTPAAAKVAEILANENIDDAAVWLDEVREFSQGRFHFTDADAENEAKDFNHDFKTNGSWHFVNYPIGLTNYEIDGKFSSPDDVVHALQHAINVLEGAHDKMTQRQALRAVIHLVGDIHQPLHCVTGFFDLSNLQSPKLLAAEQVADPVHTDEDRGGNQLFYTKTLELHALWDSGLPQPVAKRPADLTAAMSVSDLPNQPVTAGDYHHWPEKWASDSMAKGKNAYDGIAFVSAERDPDPNRPDNPAATTLKILVALPGGTLGYKKAQTSVAEEQLRLAAIHLAQLLSKINFQ